MTPSLEGWSTKAKEAPSPHEVRPAPLNINPVFQGLGGILSDRFTIDFQFGHAHWLKNREIWQSIKVYWSMKSWKPFHLFGRSSVFKPINFFHNYIMVKCFFFLKKYRSRNCHWFKMNRNYPSQRIDYPVLAWKSDFTTAVITNREH